MQRHSIRPMGQAAAGWAGAAVPGQGFPPGGGSASIFSGAEAGMLASASAPPAPSRPGVNLASESVAGEEDPGASLDMGATGSSGSANAPGAKPVSEPPAPLNPGDEAAPGTPGTDENLLCRVCGGSGRLADAKCLACNGTGKVIPGVGGA